MPKKPIKGGMPAIDNNIIAKDTLTTGLDLLKPLNSFILSTYLSDFFNDNIIANTEIFIIR